MKTRRFTELVRVNQWQTLEDNTNVLIYIS